MSIVTAAVAAARLATRRSRAGDDRVDAVRKRLAGVVLAAPGHARAGALAREVAHGHAVSAAHLDVPRHASEIVNATAALSTTPSAFGLRTLARRPEGVDLGQPEGRHGLAHRRQQRVEGVARTGREVGVAVAGDGRERDVLAASRTSGRCRTPERAVPGGIDVVDVELPGQQLLEGGQRRRRRRDRREGPDHGDAGAARVEAERLGADGPARRRRRSGPRRSSRSGRPGSCSRCRSSRVPWCRSSRCRARCRAPARPCSSLPLTV